MTLTASERNPVVPGTTGWTARDLDDPRVEREWLRGRYEIVEGVLTLMPPAYFAGGNALFNLMFLVKSHLTRAGLPGRFATEVEVVVDEPRVARADAVLLLPGDERRQSEAARTARRPDPERTRILVPPTLVIESLSPGHEQHDLRTKRAWYEAFGVPHYWLLDRYARSLQCLVRRGGGYVLDAEGNNAAEVRPSLFPGLALPLADVWAS
jgi:Uma2 family endonuclease